ncbi:hypothetical protein MTO96_037132 [Rhipicephalus appendiculatus]
MLTCPMDPPDPAPVTTPHPAAVPTGAAPIVPVDVPPARVYEEDEDEVAEVMKPHRVAAEEEDSSGIRLGVILSVAAAVTLLSAMASFSVLNLREKSAARTVAYTDSPSPATSLPPVMRRMNATQELETRPPNQYGDDEQTGGDQQPTPTDGA